MNVLQFVALFNELVSNKLNNKSPDFVRRKKINLLSKETVGKGQL